MRNCGQGAYKSLINLCGDIAAEETKVGKAGLARARAYGAGTYRKLKAKTAGLIERAGGLVAAAKGTRAGKSSLANYQDTREHVQGPGATMWAPIDIIADLEKAAGDPMVSRELARLAGYDLIPLPAAPGDFDPVVDHCRHDILMARATAGAVGMDEAGAAGAEALAAYVDALSDARDHLQRMLDRARGALAETRAAASLVA
jgi:hypothetical protein